MEQFYDYVKDDLDTLLPVINFISIFVEALVTAIQ